MAEEKSTKAAEKIGNVQASLATQATMPADPSHERSNGADETSSMHDDQAVLSSALDKGKGKAKVTEPSDDEADEDDEEEDDDEDDEDENEDEDLDEDLVALMDEVDPGEIIPITRQRSARSKPIDYSSAEAMQKAGLTEEEARNIQQAASGQQGARLDDEDDDDFKGDESMEDL